MRLQDYNFKAKEKMQLALIQHCPLFVHSVPTHTINFLILWIFPGGGNLRCSRSWSTRWGSGRPKGESIFERRTRSVSRGLPYIGVAHVQSKTSKLEMAHSAKQGYCSPLFKWKFGQHICHMVFFLGCGSWWKFQLHVGRQLPGDPKIIEMPCLILQASTALRPNQLSSDCVCRLFHD